MSNDTLVLNADYNPLCLLPLSTVDWQTAVKAVFADKATIIKEYTDWEVHSQYVTMKVPSIIVATKWINPSFGVAFNRRMVYLRDGHKCQYCGEAFHIDDLTFDHVIPRSQGGETTWDNIVTACRTCNFIKGTDPLEPMIKPRTPTYWEMARLARKQIIHIRDEAWKEYIQWPDELVKAA